MNAIRRRFAEENGMPADAVARLVRLCNRRARCAEHECNGDRHPENANPDDKNVNAALWGVCVDRAQEQIRELVKPFGLVPDFGIGLFPVLKRGDRYVEVPYE